jgi:(E)-4-hydroxy-3-methylbut-2-enyl-diphosphate synthase
MTEFTKRKNTRQIHVGTVPVGGDAPVSVQSMTTTDTRDAAATIAQIRRLAAAGCEIVRVAVPDAEAARAIRAIRQAIDLPLIADIHFDHRLAVAAAEAGADGLRINPGNIGSRDKVRAVVDAARDHGLAIRIGVNAGSLEKDLLARHGHAAAEAMVESALRHVDAVTVMGFEQIKVSIKASDVNRTLAAYRALSRRCDFPLHVGVTEAGGLYAGIVKSALGIGMLLAEGIGDTLRVSLTRDPVEEVRVGYEILRALGLRHRGAEIVSCPTCGRCRIDLFAIAAQIEQALMTRTAPIKVAVMGCTVNGPGEAREADVGVAGGDGIGILFKKGKVVKKFPQQRLVEELLAAVAEYDRDNPRDSSR